MPTFIKRTLWLLFFVLLGGGGYWYYQSQKAPAKPSYISEAVIQGDIEETVLATGTIDAYKSVLVGAQVSGQIKALHVQIGQTVKQGELIAEIDADNQVNLLQEKQATLKNYQAQLEAKKVAYDKAEQTYLREKQLLPEGATSQQSVDSALSSLAAAKADITQVQTQIEQTEIALKTARTNLGYTQIRAPMGGVVVSIPVEEGQTVNSNQAAPTIVKIAQLDRVKVKAEIAEGDVPRIPKNTPVYFTILGDDKTQYHSVLSSIDPAPKALSDGNSTTTTSSTSGNAIYYYGILSVPNPEGKLKMGMTAQVTIVLQSAKNTLLIPAAALNKKGKEYRVKVLNANGEMQEKLVQVGINNQIQVQITQGLKAGDKVIVSETDNNATKSANRPVRIM